MLMKEEEERNKH